MAPPTALRPWRLERPPASGRETSRSIASAARDMQRSPPGILPWKTEFSPDEVGPGEPVTLHVYDVGQLEDIGREGVKALNKCLRPLGSGAFHCGVEVFGQEWSFKCERHGTGVCNNRPQCCEDHSYSDSVHMGHTPMTKTEVLKIIFVLEKEWPGRCYDSLRRNCCHFCDALCMSLGVGHIPSWITHLASTGAALIDTAACIRTQSKVVEDALCGPTLFNCTCIRHSPQCGTELTFSQSNLEETRPRYEERRGFFAIGGEDAPGKRLAFLERIDALEVNGRDELLCEDGSMEDAVISKCSSVAWATCGGRSRCCSQEPARPPVPACGSIGSPRDF